MFTSEADFSVTCTNLLHVTASFSLENKLNIREIVYHGQIKYLQI